MDPQSAWELLLEAYTAGEWDRVKEVGNALKDWLNRGGFPPRAVTGADMGDDWDRAIALAGCAFALRRAHDVQARDES